MSVEDEGADFVASFRTTFGTREHLERRAKAERRAGMTKKQRERAKGPPKTQKNFRATAETVAQLKALVAKLGSSETDVIAVAIAALAEQHGVRP